MRGSVPGHADLHAQPLRPRRRSRGTPSDARCIIDLEARLARQIVDGGDVGREGETELGTIAQREADLDDVLARDVDRRHAVGGGARLRPRRRAPSAAQRVDDLLAIHS